MHMWLICVLCTCRRSLNTKEMLLFVSPSVSIFAKYRDSIMLCHLRFKGSIFAFGNEREKAVKSQNKVTFWFENRTLRPYLQFLHFRLLVGAYKCISFFFQVENFVDLSPEAQVHFILSYGMCTIFRVSLYYVSYRCTYSQHCFVFLQDLNHFALYLLFLDHSMKMVLHVHLVILIY